MSKCIVVNLYGTPGAGKSTGAAYIYSQLKLHGINAELVREYIKDKVWEENHTPLEPDNQCYVFGKQFYRMNTVQKNVDVIVTDAPLIHSIFYNTSECLGEPFNQVVRQCFDTFDNLNYMILRSKPYNPKGRIQTAEESDNMVQKFYEFFQKQNIAYRTMYGEQSEYDKIVEQVLHHINLKKDVNVC